MIFWKVFCSPRTFTQAHAVTLQSQDTHPRAEAMQIKLLRQAGAAKRTSITFRLTHSARTLSLQNLQRQHPDWTLAQCRFHLFELLHGKELAHKVRARLAQV